MRVVDFIAELQKCLERTGPNAVLCIEDDKCDYEVRYIKPETTKFRGVIVGIAEEK